MQTVVVTGVSSGIGHAIAKLLLAKGFAVFGSVRKSADAERLILEFGGTFITPLIFDVTDEFAAVGFTLGIPTIVLAHLAFDVAFVASIVRTRLSYFDATIEEAAADLGAPPGTVFLRVTLPLLAPAVAAGWLARRSGAADAHAAFAGAR